MVLPFLKQKFEEEEEKEVVVKKRARENDALLYPPEGSAMIGHASSSREDLRILILKLQAQHIL